MRGLIKKGIDTYLDWRSFKIETPLVVIESDDWGSLRTKDKKTRNKLNAISPKIKNDPYSQLDSIATQDDLEALFQVLLSVKDAKGNPACFTPNVCTANPNFDAIKTSGFNEFFYKPFTKTLEEYSIGGSLFRIWNKGTDEKVFKPQLHGREHVHGLAWLAELKAGNKELLKAFNQETWGIPYQANLNQRRANLQASLDVYGLKDENIYHKVWIKDSVSLFKKAFGYDPKSFIPPAYTWHYDIHKYISEEGIKTLQGIKLQNIPLLKYTKKYKRDLHYLGEKDKYSSLIYAPRNAFLEPYSEPHKDWVDITMSSVNKAIQAKKPVIIGSHRINYIGRLDTKHRDQNLKILQQILKQIVEKYPDVEFMDSGSLARLFDCKND